MRLSSKVVFIFLLTISAVSCGTDTTSRSTQATELTEITKSASVTDFDATLLGGGDVNLQAELQKSPVALWFWAPG